MFLPKFSKNLFCNNSQLWIFIKDKKSSQNGKFKYSIATGRFFLFVEFWNWQFKSNCQHSGNNYQGNSQSVCKKAINMYIQQQKKMQPPKILAIAYISFLKIRGTLFNKTSLNTPPKQPVTVPSMIQTAIFK
jgi:hypothetical protein